MFVSLNGQRVPLTLGRWNASKAVQAQITCPNQLALVELVASSSLEEAANTLGVDVDKLRQRLDEAKQAVATARNLTDHDLPILDLIDDLGYSDEGAAQILGITLRQVRKRYWLARKRLRGRRHDELIADHIPQMSRRDFAAFELYHVLHYSTGRVARTLGLNRGHLCRRLEIVRELLRKHCQADSPTPDVKT